MGITGVVVTLTLPFFSAIDFVGIFIYSIVANLFYCLGFLIEVAANHYFKSSVDFTEKRKTLFTTGLILSIVITAGIGFLLSFLAID